MSLLVNVRVYDENGEYSEIELENGKDLAGFENCRYTLYGSDLAESLGFKFLPQLKQSDLYVDVEDLEDLEKELEAILEKIDKFSQTSDLNQEYIQIRIANVLDAIQIAKKVSGVVVIW